VAFAAWNHERGVSLPPPAPGQIAGLLAPVSVHYKHENVGRDCAFEEPGLGKPDPRESSPQESEARGGLGQIEILGRFSEAFDAGAIETAEGPV
jgi:hypothetical protein